MLFLSQIERLVFWCSSKSCQIQWMLICVSVASPLMKLLASGLGKAGKGNPSAWANAP